MIGVLVSGTGSNLQALLDAGLPVVAVVSSRPGVRALDRARHLPTEVFELTDYASRTDRDVPMRWVIVGSILIVVMMWVLLTFDPMQGAATAWYQNVFAGVFVVVFGFLFVTVAGRISGLLGNSSNPISGMSIATLMATCAIFFLAGWTSPNYAVLALMIGGVVCIAAAIAGATSQDLKTGYLVGATPFWQQMGLLIGVTVSTFAMYSSGTWSDVIGPGGEGLGRLRRAPLRLSETVSAVGEPLSG